MFYGRDLHTALWKPKKFPERIPRIPRRSPRKNSLESQRSVQGVKKYQIDFEEWRKGGEYSGNEN